MKNLSLLDPAFLAVVAAGALPVTPPPPGSPEFWFDGSNIDGTGNSSLTPGAEFSSWKNRGSLVGVDLAPLPFKSNPKYYVGANIKGARFDDTGGGFAPHRGLGTGVITARNHPWMMSCIVKTASTWTSFSNNPIGAYLVAGSSSSTIGIRPGFVSFIGETWQGQLTNNLGTPVGIPFTTPGGQRQVVAYDLFTVLTFTIDGASSSFGTDHQTMAFGDVGLPYFRNFQGLAVGGSDEGLSQFMTGEMAQALVYYGTSVTHAQIVAWAETVYGGTSPFAP